MKDDDVTTAVAGALEGRTVAAAESCTAGRVVADLAAIEHASEIVRGGVVAYQEEVKRNLLGVTSPSVYSEDAVIQMAGAVRELFGADAAVATSGVAGQEPIDGVAPGTVFVATMVGGVARSAVHHFTGSPEQVCDAAARRALHDLLDALRDHDLSAGEHVPTSVADGRP
jgi:nicotinamide-nucleotide amidase